MGSSGCADGCGGGQRRWPGVAVGVLTWPEALAAAAELTDSRSVNSDLLLAVGALIRCSIMGIPVRNVENDPGEHGQKSGIRQTRQVIRVHRCGAMSSVERLM